MNCHIWAYETLTHDFFFIQSEFLLFLVIYVEEMKRKNGTFRLQAKFCAHIENDKTIFETTNGFPFLGSYTKLTEINVNKCGMECDTHDEEANTQVTYKATNPNMKFLRSLFVS